MSLQIWLPLNNDLNNQGLLGPLTQTAAPTFVNGKFGKSLSSGGCSMTAEQTASVLNNNEVSICFWIYINADTGAPFSGNNLLFGNSSNRRYALFCYPTVNDLHCSWENVSGSYITAGVYQGVLPSYTWTHVAVTYKNPTGKIYINGELIATFTANCNTQFNYVTQVISNNSFKRFNDYRVYNHCLSVNEIKHIYKGLMLHLPLNGGEGGINLLKGTLACYATSSKKYNTGTDLSFDTNIIPLNKLIGKTITFSFDYSIEGDKLNTSGGWQVQRFGAHLGVSYVNSSGASVTGYPCTSYLFESPTSGGTGRAVQTYTFPSDCQSIQSFTIFTQPFNQPAANNTATWYIKNFKIELGDADTGYSINPNTLGAAHKLADCSGYKNNGSIGGFVESNKNSARYDCSTRIEGLNYITLPNISYENMDEGTLSFWIKFNKFNNWSHYVFIANGFNWTGHGLDFIIVANNSPLTAEAETTNINIDCCSYNRSFSAAKNQWYHIVITWDAKNYVIKKYLNGSRIVTHNDSTNKKLDTYRSKHNYHFIGNGMKGTTYSGDFCISDFRVYSNLLSDNDINQLYNVAAQTNKNGETYAYSIVEGSSPKINKTGIVEGKEFVESNNSLKLSKNSISSNNFIEI